jgi:hypothetical protein
MRRQCCVVSILALAAFLCLPANAVHAGTPDSVMSVEIDHEGHVSVSLHIVSPLPDLRDTLLQGRSRAVLAVLLPFEERDEWSVSLPADVRAAPIATGVDHTLLALVAPVAQDAIDVRIEHCTSLVHAPEDKDKLLFDLSYQHILQEDIDFLNDTPAVVDWDIQIVLPTEYEDTEVSLFPPWLTKSSARVYSLRSSTVIAEGVEQVWIAFPSVRTERLILADALARLIVGLGPAVFPVLAKDRRRLDWAVVSGVFSFLALGAVWYFSRSLVTRAELLVKVAPSLPAAVASVLVSAYLAAAKIWQGSISGEVTIDGEAQPYVDVSLLRIENGGERTAGTLHDADRGRYEFRVWLWRSRGKFRIRATAQNAEAAEIGPFTLVRRKRFPAPPLVLARSVQPAAGLVASSASRSRYFHLPTCPRAARIGDRTRVGFATAEQAASAGYTECPHCLSPEKS